jgi:hypothetical protein
MPVMPAQISIQLTDSERMALEKAVSSSITPIRFIKRAKAILMASDNIPSYNSSFGVQNGELFALTS